MPQVIEQSLFLFAFGKGVREGAEIVCNLWDLTTDEKDPLAID